MYNQANVRRQHVGGAIARQIGDYERDLMRTINRRAEPRRHALKEGPSKLVRLVDPDGRYQIEVPREWRCGPGPGLFAASPTLGAFARVDVLPDEADLWNTIVGGVAAAGGTLQIAEQRGRSRRHAIGVLTLGERGWHGEGIAERLDAKIVMLTIARLDDPPPRPSLRTMQEHTLRAIRRRFKVPADAS